LEGLKNKKEEKIMKKNEVKITTSFGGVMDVFSLASKLRDEEVEFYNPYEGVFQKSPEFHRSMELWAKKVLRRRGK
jgi:hypothetical protein